MRALPSALVAALESGATTLCWCWRIARRDGVVLGFTDHDRTLTFGGADYRAASARAVGSVQSEAGFAAGSAAIAGMLEDEAISSDDIAKGFYEGARVELHRVDWSDPSARVRVWSGFLGDVVRGELGFEAELRGRQSTLERSIGRSFQRRCDALLGDVRCGVDLDHPDLRAEGAATSVIDARSFRASGLVAFADGWFARGVLAWTSGANLGARAEVEAHRAGGSMTVIELMTPPSAPIAPGDGFVVDAGCDKRWITCKAKFANAVNFRGFPMIPGDDWLAAGPRSGDTNDGGSLWTDRSA